MKNKHRMTLFLLISALLLGTLAACQREEEQEPQETAQAASPLNEVNELAVGGFGDVSAEGEVVPDISADLSFQIGGTVAEILVESGDTLSAGDPIMRLDSEILQNNLSQAEAGLTSAEAALEAAKAELAVAQSGVQRAQLDTTAAEAQLALTRAGATDEELEAAENNLAAADASIVAAAGDRDASVRVSDAAVQSAQAQVALAQAQLDQLQRTYDTIIDTCFEKQGGGEFCPLYGPVEEQTRAQLEAAKVNLAAAQAAEAEARAGATPAERQLANTGVSIAAASRDQAQAQLDLLLAGPRTELIQQAEVGVAQAQLGEEQAQVQVTLAEAAVTQAEAAVTQAEANVQAAQKALERMTLTAPFDGAVGDVLTEVGELVIPGQPVARYADFSNWLVKTTDLTELDVVAVKNGLPARIILDAVPGEEIAGIVTDIASVASVVRGDVTYEVTIDLDDDADLPLRWGMTAAVDIETE
ncbi:MAG: HlyD family efflux transporter periplasmic adaptor subunit [Candidatus Promineifilaceae bacterium]|nr:HlyD family efflux transporter periplasmic adaptor subunit [Candidatus Promineifilaceae bacterium]